MTFVERIRGKAAELKRRIVFPESGDERILSAARELDRTGMATPILVTDNARLAAGFHPGRLSSVHAEDEPALEFAHRLVAQGGADACVAGAVYTTADVLRSALSDSFQEGHSWTREAGGGRREAGGVANEL